MGSSSRRQRVHSAGEKLVLVVRGPFTPRSLADPCGSPYELPLIVREAWDHETAVRMPIFRGSSGDGADSVTSVGGRPLFPFRHPFGKVPQSEEAGDRVP